jgi:hypothetical protein
MRIMLSVLLCFCAYFLPAQKLNVQSLETILNSSYPAADSFLKKQKFKLADKETAEGYHNYYYTSFEKAEKNQQLLRSLSLMDVYSGEDTSRLILYRTYNKKDNEELVKQLLASGYELIKRTGNDFTYKNGNYTVINKIAEKNISGNKTVTSYEFELGR